LVECLSSTTICKSIVRVKAKCIIIDIQSLKVPLGVVKRICSMKLENSDTTFKLVRILKRIRVDEVRNG